MIRRLFFLALVLGLPATALGQETGEGLQFNRFGADVHYGGHLLFHDVLGVQGQWILLDRERFFLSDLIVEGGIGVAIDFRFFEIPALVRAELMHWRYVGFELSLGGAATLFDGTVGLAPVGCASIPVSVGRFRLQPEACFNPSAGTPIYGVGLAYRL